MTISDCRTKPKPQTGTKAEPLLAEIAAADIVHLRFSPETDIEIEHAAEYLGDMLADMRIIASRAGLKFLSALIEVAIEEAKLQSQNQIEPYPKIMKA